MHLGDGTLANQVCAVTAAGSAAALAFAIARARRHADRSTLARAAAGTVLVFLAQLVDVPLFGGTGAHLIGAALLVALAGPALALLGMAGVVAAQALLLGDGGVVAMGANVMNMGVIAVGAAWALMGAVRVQGAGGRLSAVALASAGSVIAAVAAMSLQLVASGTPAGEVFPLTMTAHAPFAAWETLVTTLLAAAALGRRGVSTTDAAASDRV